MKNEIKKLKDENIVAEPINSEDTKELSDSELESVSAGLKTKVGGGEAVVVSKRVNCFIDHGAGWERGFGVSHDCYNSPYLDRSKCRNKDHVSLRKTWAVGCAVNWPQCGSCLHLKFKGGLGYCGKSIN